MVKFDSNIYINMYLYPDATLSELLEKYDDLVQVYVMECIREKYENISL